MAAIVKRIVRRPAGGASPVVADGAGTVPRRPGGAAQPRVSLKASDAGERVRAANPNAIPWEYYDQYILGTTAMPGESAAINYAQWQATMSFFAGHTKANTKGLCNNSKENALDSDFVVQRAGVEISAPVNPAFTAGSSASVDFVQLLTGHAVFQIIDKNGTPIYDVKLSRMRTGGGLFVQGRDFAQGAAANREGGTAGNGRPDGFFPPLERSILLRQDEGFTMQIVTPNLTSSAGPLTQIQALTALAAGQFVNVTLILGGIKGPPETKGRLRGLSLPI